MWGKAVTICYNFVIENRRDQIYWYVSQTYLWQNMVLCDNCGHDNKETAKFCHSCGTKIEVEIVAPVVEKKSTAKILEEERKKAEAKIESKNPLKAHGQIFKRKKRSKIEPYPSVSRDWFWDTVEFRRQSKLAIGLGIFQVICSFLMLLFPGDPMLKFLMFIVMICVGAVLISLGARQVPDYPSLKYAIEDYVGSKIKHS